MRRYCFVIALFLAVFAVEGFCEGMPSDGLHIIKAEYGASDAWVDVIVQVREKVQGDKLSLKAGNWMAGDPIFGASKSLKVEYILDGKKETVSVSEGSVLNIPARPGDSFVKCANNKSELLKLISECPADVGFYGVNLSTGETLEYQPDKPACLASIVKIFVLLEVVRQEEEGAIDLSQGIEYEKSGTKVSSTVSEALDKMIGQSDNEATNALARLVGYDRVNALPKQLGIDGLGEKILPEPKVLGKVLDKRIFFKRSLPEGYTLAQHGTARGIVKYFELLGANKLINEKISGKVMEVFERNPKGFAVSAVPRSFKGLGKGGSLAWKRPFFKQYNMYGWGMLLRGEEASIAFCIWYEWFPEGMDESERHLWRQGISDSAVKLLL